VQFIKEVGRHDPGPPNIAEVAQYFLAQDGVGCDAYRGTIDSERAECARVDEVVSSIDAVLSVELIVAADKEVFVTCRAIRSRDGEPTCGVDDDGHKRVDNFQHDRIQTLDGYLTVRRIRLLRAGETRNAGLIRFCRDQVGNTG